MKNHHLFCLVAAFLLSAVASLAQTDATLEVDLAEDGAKEEAVVPEPKEEPTAASAPVAANAPVPDVTATVTLPYDELKRLWELAHEAADEKEKAELEEEAPKPPVAAILRSADYRLEFAGRDLLLDAEFQAENLDEEWQALALLSGGFSITAIEPEDAMVVRRDEGYELLLPPKTRIDVRLSLEAPEALPASWWVEHALPAFQPAPASVRRLAVAGLPEDVRLTFGGIEWAAGVAGEETRPRVLAGGDRAIDWGLAKIDADSPAGVPTDDAMPTPVPWQLRSELFAAFDEGRLAFQMRIHAHTDAENGGRVLHLLLPAGARGISAEGENLVRHRELAREKPTDPRKLELLWSDADRAEREFTIEFELAQSPLAEQWQLPLPVSEPAAESAALAVVRVNEGLEITGDGVRAASGSAGLPRWMSEATGGEDFVSLDLDAGRAVDIRWLPRVNTAPAVVAEARAVTRLVADGALLIHAEFHIDHEAPLHWSLSLPEGSELLTAFVNGVAARPIQRDDTTLELQLPVPAKRSGDDDAPGGQTLVRLAYAGSVEAFDPVTGSVALELPDTPLFVHRLLWDVHIPEGYETSAIDGNVAIDAEREHCEIAGKTASETRREEAAATRAIQLRKELIRNEAPEVEIFYRSILSKS